MKKILLSLAAFLVLTFVSMSAQADVIFTQSPFSTAGGLISGPDPMLVDDGNTHQVYDDFTVGYSTTITKITWWGIAYGTPQFTITFHGSAAGAVLPGATFSGTVAQSSTIINGTPIDVYSLTLGTGYNLSPGTYWLSIYNTDSGTSWAWQIADYGNGSYQVPFDPLNSTSNVAFKLEGTQVPVPAAFWLLGPGLAGLAALRHRRRMR